MKKVILLLVATIGCFVCEPTPAGQKQKTEQNDR